MTYDLIVVGLGGVGLSIAAEAAGRGLRVVGLDALPRAGGLRSTEGRSRVFHSAYRDRRYVPLLESARAGWLEWSREAGERLFSEASALMLSSGPDDRGAPPMPHHVLLERWGLSLAPEVSAWSDSSGGLVNVPKTMRWLAAKAERCGADLRFDRPVHACAGGQPVASVSTADGVLRATAVIVAAGSWTGRLLGELAPVVSVHVSAYGLYDLSSAPRLRDLPPFVDSSAAEQLYGAVEGNQLKVGSQARPTARPSDDASPEAFAAVERFVAQRFGPLPRLISRRSAPTLRTPDGSCLLGPVPTRDRVLVAAGMSGHGFKLLPAISSAVADHLTGGASLPSFLSPSRWPLTKAREADRIQTVQPPPSRHA